MPTLPAEFLVTLSRAPPGGVLRHGAQASPSSPTHSVTHVPSRALLLLAAVARALRSLLSLGQLYRNTYSCQIAQDRRVAQGLHGVWCRAAVPTQTPRSRTTHELTPKTNAMLGPSQQSEFRPSLLSKSHNSGIGPRVVVGRGPAEMDHRQENTNKGSGPPTPEKAWTRPQESGPSAAQSPTRAAHSTPPSHPSIYSVRAPAQLRGCAAAPPKARCARAGFAFLSRRPLPRASHARSSQQEQQTRVCVVRLCSFARALPPPPSPRYASAPLSPAPCPTRLAVPPEEEDQPGHCGNS